MVEDLAAGCRARVRCRGLGGARARHGGPKPPNFWPPTVLLQLESWAGALFGTSWSLLRSAVLPIDFRWTTAFHGLSEITPGIRGFYQFRHAFVYAAVATVSC